MAEQNFTSGHCFDCLLRCAEMSTFDRRQEKNMQSQTLQNTDEHKSGLFVYLFLFYPLFASKTFQKIILIRKCITQSFQLPTIKDASLGLPRWVRICCEKRLNACNSLFLLFLSISLWLVLIGLVTELLNKAPPSIRSFVTVNAVTMAQSSGFHYQCDLWFKACQQKLLSNFFTNFYWWKVRKTSCQFL